MLDSMPPFVDVLLSNGEQWLWHAVVDAPQRAANTVITPNEPSTLALALVGIATVTIYVAARGLRRRHASRATGTHLKFDATVRRPPTNRPQKTPRRGAA